MGLKQWQKRQQQQQQQQRTAPLPGWRNAID
jgi:hypothetical protein